MHEQSTNRAISLKVVADPFAEVDI
jgi:hypothetical protein